MAFRLHDETVGYKQIIIACTAVAVQAWSRPFYPVQRAPTRFTRYAPPPQPYRLPGKLACPFDKRRGKWRRNEAE
ncbi:hypothetical protein MSG28_007281 [Choristoneura fumiferana]|uniref:Uncharacterized protein n=1 Tax=Choristoneura fumiferana TaxID=7141 RepID=A0ACC0JWW5_CHOFU|nr:hypothetical protein MSG28_007281 [Choristoneura fumiferana]